MAQNNDDFTRIDELKRRLYEHDATTNVTKRSKLSLKNTSLPTKWSSAEVNSNDGFQSIRQSILYKVAIASAIFFVLALGVAGFWLISGSNIVSNRNIDFSIKGPATVKAGDQTSFQIILVNKNKLPLEQVTLTTEFPKESDTASTESASSTTKDVYSIIQPGESINKIIDTTVLDQENTTRSIKAHIEYRIAGSNAIYTKDTSFDFTVGSSPVDVSLTTLPEVTTGSDVSMKIKVASNAQAILKNVALSIDYPPGFAFQQSTLAPLRNNSFWFFGDLQPGEEKDFTIQGNIKGQNEEVKTFQLLTGSVDDKDQEIKNTIFSKLFKTITVKQPFVATNIVVNDVGHDDVVIAGGSIVKVDINWINNLTSPTIDNILEVSLDGNTIDKDSINAASGFYYSGQNKIVWTKNSVPALASIAPGQKGGVSFTFGTFPLSATALSGVVNPTIKLHTNLKSNRISEDFNAQTVQSDSDKNIKVQTLVQLAGRVIRSSGPFTNTGPIPPQSDKETTYTIAWSVLNSSNDIQDGIVSATLPPYIKWLGQTSPARETVNYNPIDNKITWKLGKVAAGTGQSILPRELYFQVSFTPSLSQIGSSPLLVGPATFEGFDTFAGTMVKLSSKELSTRIVTEPGFQEKDAQVQRQPAN